jgi:hypothetical protein
MWSAPVCAGVRLELMDRMDFMDFMDFMDGARSLQVHEVRREPAK